MSKSRVLFISNLPFSNGGNDGKTYLSLFKDFKTDEVAQLYFNNVFSNSKVFTNYFRVTDLEILLNKLTLGYVKIKGAVAGKKAEKIANGGVQSVELPLLLKKVTRNFIHSFFNITKTESFNLWVEKFEPTVIFFVGGNYEYSYKMLEDISTKYGIPYYVYFTDDYFIYNNGNNHLEYFFHKRFKAKCFDIVKKAEELFVISPKMKLEYEAFFNKKCTVLINAADNFPFPTSTSLQKKTITFRYFGWLHSDRLSSLIYLSDCLQYINENTDLTCKLEVFSLTNIRNTKWGGRLNDSIEIKKPLSGEVFEETLKSSDFLVHAESFNSANAKSTRLSISTKVPEYLISNRCVVAVGPPYLASIAIFEEFGLGISITENNKVEKYANEILKVIKDDNLYKDFCNKSIDFYKKEFDATRMRRDLKEKLLK